MADDEAIEEDEAVEDEGYVEPYSIADLTIPAL